MATVPAKAWLDGNTMYVELGSLDEPLRDGATGDVVTDATVGVTVFDANGGLVSGASWPVVMPHLGGGIYGAPVPAGVNLGIGAQGSAVIQATTPAGSQGLWNVPLVGKQRIA